MVDPTDRPVPWEDESVPFPANLGLTWWDCLVSPDRFFGRLSWQESFVRALLYFLVVTILASLLGLFWYVWGPWAVAEQLGLTFELQLLSFFLTPFVMLLALGGLSLVQHLFVILLAPGRRGLGATATVLCYASGVGIVTAALPPALGFAGRIPGMLGATYVVIYFTIAVAVQVWSVIVAMAGVRRAHSTTTGQAAAIVLLPIAIALTLGVALVVVAAALLALAELPV